MHAERARWQEWSDAILHGYAIIFFSQSRLLGAALLLATCLAPRCGVFGLAGMLIAQVAAEALGFEHKEIRNGAYLFNSLLVSLALAILSTGWSLDWPMLLVLLTTCSVLTLFVTVFLSSAMLRWWNLPSLSLPFVLVAPALYLLCSALGGSPADASAPAYLLPEPSGFPAPLYGFLQAFGTIFFLPHALVGMVVLLGVLWLSPLSVLFAVIGYAGGVQTLGGLHVDTSQHGLIAYGFNFIFCAIALGGIFIIPSRSGLWLVALGSVCCALFAIAAKTLCSLFDLPPLALPFNLTVLAMLAALRLRATPRLLHVTPFPPGTPEENFYRFHTEALRFPDLCCPHLRLPFFGEWTVTQGMDGRVTHRGAWMHALDFEVLDEQGRRYCGPETALSSYYSYGAPVLAPCYGTVVKTIAHVEDNPIGGNNLDDNWGNLVLMLLDTGGYVLVCHLAKGSVLVAEGARVAPGDIIAQCGNSGRSPVPHLHLHIQQTSALGAPTLPFTLSQYVECGSMQRYRTSGTPTQGSRLRAVAFDDRMSACFDRLIDRQYRYRITASPDVGMERITCIVNETGAYIFTSAAPRAMLTARMIDRVFYTLEYRGSRHSMLLYCWLGLCRVPLTLEDGLCWNERMDARPLLKSWVRSSLDLWGLFVQAPTVHVTAAVHSVDAGQSGVVRLTTRFAYPGAAMLYASQAPREIELLLAPNQGIISGVIRLARGEITIEQMTDTASTQQATVEGVPVLSFVEGQS